MTRRPVIGLSTGVLPFPYGAVPDYPLNYVPDEPSNGMRVDLALAGTFIRTVPDPDRTRAWLTEVARHVK